MRTEFAPGISPGVAGTPDYGVHVLHAHGGEVVLPSREIMLESMYARSGPDLVITSPEDGKFVIKGFFLSDTPPPLSDGAGTHISGEMAAQFAGPVSLNQYAGQTNAVGAAIGQVRSLAGVAEVTRANGTVVVLKIGDPVYLDDTVETKAGAKIGLILIDGTVLALGEKGELVLDELVYDPSTKGGKAALSLVSGAAEFVSGSIAKSGQDAMTFKTPVGTIGIRGTKVFATYDPVTGEVTILNRPTGTGANGQVLAGEIVLTLPNGQVIGNMTAGDGGWQWNAAQGQTPQPVQLTPAQAQSLVAGVAGIVNNLQQIQQQQQNTTTPGAPGDQNGGQGGAGGQGGGQGNGQGSGSTTGDAGTSTTQTAAVTTPTTTTNAFGQTTFNIGAATTTTTTSTTTTGTTTGTTTNQTTTPTTTTTPGTTTTTTPPPPPPVQDAQVRVQADTPTVNDKGENVAVFTITRSVNTTSTVTVNYSTVGGSATAETDFRSVSGTVTFQPNEISKQIVVPILNNGRSEGAETFSLQVTAGAGAVVAGGPAEVTISADPALPTVAINSVTVSDTVAGVATLTVTRTGEIYAPSTVTYTTVSGSATAGQDFETKSGTITFAAGQATATVQIQILANSTPLTSANREGVETFSVVLSNPTDATIAQGGGTGTVTISADPGLAIFSVADSSGSEGGAAVITITRGGDLTGTVSVNYSIGGGTATPGTDYTGGSGTLTFGPNETSKTISVPIANDTVTDPGETFSVQLSNPIGGDIGNGTATVTITDTTVVVVPAPPETTILGAYADNAYAVIKGSGGQIYSDSTVAVSSHTFEAWIRPADSLGDGYNGQPSTIMAFPGSPSLYMMYQTDHHVSVQITVSGATRKIVSSMAISPDAWHHVAYSYNDTTGELKLYVDGVEDTAATHPNNDALTFTSNTSMFIGGGATPYQGGIDEVRLWDTVRTSTQIRDNTDKTFSSTTQNLQIQYSFENFNGTVADNTGIGGAVYNGNTSTAGPGPNDADKTLFFDGATHITTNVTQPSVAFTLQATIRLLTNTGADRPIFSKPTVSGGADETVDYELFINSSNQLVLRMGQGSGNGFVDFTGKTLLAGVTYDVAAVYNAGSGQVSLYVDGELYTNGASQSVAFGGTRQLTGGQPLDVGHHNNGSDSYFSGYMTNVRVWDVPFGQSAIQTTNQGVPAGANGLIVFYAFDEGTGASVRDISGNGHTGTISGTTSYVFDGAPQLQFIGTTVSLDEDGAGSVQFIGKPGTAGATLTFSIVSGPAHGTATITPSGLLSYKPTTNYSGTDGFTLKLTDSAGGETTKTLNFVIQPINDRPFISTSLTLPTVNVNETNPTGYTIDAKFGTSFVDPDGTFVGVVVMANTANTSTQGNWQYSTDGTNWYSFGTITSASGQLLLSKNTYIRFVPVTGYSGSPGGLIVRVIDSAYVSNGGTFTAGSSTVSLQDLFTASTHFLLSERPTVILVGVGAAAPATASWDNGGADGDWNTAANWDNNIEPGAVTAVTLGGSANVTLASGTTTTIASLDLTGSAQLSITLAANENGTELAVTGTTTIGSSAQLTLVDGSPLSSASGSLNNLGTIKVDDGESGELHFGSGIVTNVGTSSLIWTRGDLDIHGAVVNNGTGTGYGITIEATDQYSAALYVEGNITNNGTMLLTGFNTSSGSNFTEALLDVTMGSLTNNGAITVQDGTYAGSRLLSGSFNNAVSSNLNILANAALNGSFQNAGTLQIAAGKTLSYNGSMLKMSYSGNNGTLSGSGTLWLDDYGSSSDSYFYTPSGFTLAAGGPTLKVGNYAGNNGARWIATGVTAIAGTVNINSGIFEGSSTQWVLSGTMNLLGGFAPEKGVNTNNIHTSLNLTGTTAGWSTNTYAFKITGTGAVNVTGGGLNSGISDDDETVNVSISNGFKNEGVITLSSTGADVTFQISAGNYSNANPDDNSNTLAYNAGTIDIQGGGGARSFAATDLRNSGSFLVHTDTTYTGRLTNSGTFTIYGGATFTMGENTDLNLSSGWTYNGTGTSVLHVRGGDQSASSAESYLTFYGNATIGANMKLIVGDVSDNYSVNYTDHEGRVVDGSSGHVLLINNGGQVEMRNGGISMDTTIGSGGSILATGRNGSSIGGNFIVSAGGSLSVLNANSFSIGISTSTTSTINGTVVVDDTSTDGFETALAFSGDVVLNGTVTLQGTSGDDVLLQISDRFTIADGASLNIGSHKVFMASNDAILEMEEGGSIVLTSGGKIEIWAGELSLNLDTGQTNYSLVSGATISAGYDFGSYDPVEIGGQQTNSSPITIDVFGTLELVKANIGALLDVKSGGLLKAIDGTATLAKTLNVSSGGNVQVTATNGGTTTLTATDNVTNAGVITLTGTSGTARFELTGTGVYLNNSTTGDIIFGSGTGISEIKGDLDNHGDIVINGNAQFDVGNTNFENTSTATMNINAGASLLIYTSSTGQFVNDGFVSINDNGNTNTTISANVTNMSNGLIRVLDISNGGGTTGDSQLNLSGTVDNTGTITLEVGGGNHAANLNLTGGVLNNNSGGTLAVLGGNGQGTHTITGEINNSGTIFTRLTTTFAIGSTNFDNLSGGTFTVYFNSASFTNSGGAFSNHAGATVTIDSGASLKMNGTNFINAGTLTVNGTLYMGNGVDNNTVDSFADDTDGGDLDNSSGTITGSGVIQMEGGTFTPGGSSTITPGNSPGKLTIAGNAIFGDLTRTVMELAGTNAGQFDVLNVTGRFALGGTLSAVSYAGFAAAAGDHFEVMNWGSHTGMFQDMDGLDSMPGVALDPTFSDHGLTFTARAITAEGGETADVLVGTDQADVIVGRGGDDVLDGGLGDDLLIGGTGNDVLKGGAGSNHLIGGQGADTVDYGSSTSGVHVDLANGTADNGMGGTDTLISIEKIIGSAHDDIIKGSYHADIIVGGAGNDIIVGGRGADVLTGGPGNDVFVLHNPNEDGDTITDFTSGQDVIELNATSFGFAPGTDVGTCFSIIAGPFDGHDAGTNAAFAAGHSALIYSQADHTLYFDANGAGEGYTTVATLQPNAVLVGTDIRITDHMAA